MGLPLKCRRAPRLLVEPDHIAYLEPGEIGVYHTVPVEVDLPPFLFFPLRKPSLVDLNLTNKAQKGIRTELLKRGGGK